MLKGAIERLHAVAGPTLFGAFEHEFQFGGAEPGLGEAYSLRRVRAERRLAG